MILKFLKIKFLKICILLISILCLTIPSNNQAILTVDSSSILSTISFSGYEWNVKNSGGVLWGPGPNLFNDSIQNVFVDSNGSLHLKITHNICLDQWFCAELYTIESFGYGIYQFSLESGLETNDKNIVLGLFTYLDDENEIDIEFAKWGEDTDKNGQYVIQPSWKLNHKKRFEFDPQGEYSVHGFSWCKTVVDFYSYTDSYNFNWRYYGSGIPRPSTEHVHINLWLRQGLPPSDYNEVEVVINSFMFTPSECTDSPISFGWILTFSLIGLIAIIFTLTFLIVRKRKNKISEQSHRNEWNK
jgi:hypothetical protein